MLNRLIAVLLFLAAFPAQADRLRQFHHETPLSFEQIVNALEQRFPRQVGQFAPGAAALAYSGTSVPHQLAQFLTETFEELPADTLAPGKPVSLSLTLHGQNAGTVLSLMVMARFADASLPVHPDSHIVLDGTGPGECQGQLVLAHPASRVVTAKAYLAYHEAQGFVFPKTAVNKTSFFIGHAQGCEITMYLQTQGDATMVVIRYLED